MLGSLEPTNLKDYGGANIDMGNSKETYLYAR